MYISFSFLRLSVQMELVEMGAKESVKLEPAKLRYGNSTRVANIKKLLEESMESQRAYGLV